MSDLVNIEQLKENDLEAYLKLAHGFLKSSFHLGIDNIDDFVQRTRPIAQKLLYEPNTLLLIAKKSDLLVGYLAANIMPALHLNGYDCMVRELYVSSEYRRNKIGSLLLEYIEQLAIQKGCNRISLATKWGNEIQNSFYMKNGFDRRCDFIVKML